MPCLQGKEEFEKTQKELLEKGNIMRQGKGQLELQQVRVPGSPAWRPWARAACLQGPCHPSLLSRTAIYVLGGFIREFWGNTYRKA